PSSASNTDSSACPVGVRRYQTSRSPATSRVTIPSASRARRRALSPFDVIVASDRRRSLKRRGPPSRSRTINSDHFSPIVSRARAAGQKCWYRRFKRDRASGAIDAMISEVYALVSKRYLSPVEEPMTAETATERGADWKPTACILCECNCGILVKLGGEDGRRFEQIRGDKAQPASQGYTCQSAAEKTGEACVNGLMRGTPVRGDFEHCEVAVFVGKHPWQSHSFPHARLTLRNIAKDPARSLIVIDPRRTETAELAEFYLQV